MKTERLGKIPKEHNSHCHCLKGAKGTLLLDICLVQNRKAVTTAVSRSSFFKEITRG